MCTVCPTYVDRGTREGKEWRGHLSSAKAGGVRVSIAMQSHDLAQSTDNVANISEEDGDLHDNEDLLAGEAQPPVNVSGEDLAPPIFRFLRRLSPFWHDRLIEAGLILSLGLYYLVGNPQFGAGNVLYIPPYLYSLPFLAIFACLTWYRLPFAVALVPLALPYYYIQKTVFSYHSYDLKFGLGEISVAVCALVAIGQWLAQGRRWRYRLSWAKFRERLGPFPIPILIFVAAALISIGIAVERQTALRSFREEVFDPLVYLLLVLCCLRTRQDLLRMVGALLGSALLIACIGLVQYVVRPVQPQQPTDVNRAHAVYGSANSIGLFFDYILPFGLALLVWQVEKMLRTREKWWPVVLLLLFFVPLIAVLILSQSLGTALALPVALLFILALSIRDRRTLLLGASVLVVLGLAAGMVLHKQLLDFLTTWHDNGKGISTVLKRYYLWLTALQMIRHHALFGVGMDNWLCYYSINDVCKASHVINSQYWIRVIPGTNIPTGLKDEPALSHPHDIFLQIWASIGIFGLLAFLAILAFFGRLFARILKTVRQSTRADVASLEWLVLGVGGAMLAALTQGLVDSSFLEQDLAFCFWGLLAALLLLRVLTGTPWRATPKTLAGETAHEIQAAGVEQRDT